MTTQELFEDNLPVAYSIAKRHWNRPGHRHLRAEIEQAALIGLWDACKRWNPTRGINLNSYAGKRVHGAIFDWFRVEEFGHPKRNKKRLLDRATLSTETVLSRSQDGSEETLGQVISAPEQPDLVAVRDEILQPLRTLRERELSLSRVCQILTDTRIHFKEKQS